jgi:hypothetical protein
MAYFFAYGDRMNAQQMHLDLPDAEAVGPALLEGFRLVFNVTSRSWGGGAANAQAHPGGRLWGVLWRLSDEEMATLDSFRGDEQAHMVLEVEVEVDGPEGRVPARTFSVDSPDRFVEPTERYAAMLRSAAQAQGLPDEAIQAIDLAASGGPGSSSTI